MPPVAAGTEEDSPLAPVPGCIICRKSEGDPELGRVQVWEDDLWRLTTALEGPALGFTYLEPKRHVPHITDLVGEEARTFGEVLARASRALRSATSAEVVYVYVFGTGVAHLHVHLAPHRRGDVYNDQMLRGEVDQRHLPSGATSMASKDFPDLPAAEHEAARDRIRKEMAGATADF
jgi:diadenosine tetraphosphate (Ap4A) HIT family hydrolase